MMITLRGLPPDIEVSEIRSYIYGRCAVGRVLVDDLETDADGTRRVTVATSSDADAFTLRRVLSGERLGVYKLLVEPCQPQNAFSNLRNNSGPGDRAGLIEGTSGGSFGLDRNTGFNIRGSGDLGGSSGRGGHTSGGRGQYIGRGGGGLRGHEGTNLRDFDEAGSVGRGHGGFIGQSGQPHGRESIGFGKHNRGEDSIARSSSKIRRDVSERDVGFGSSGIDFIRNSSQSRGGYSGPNNSHAGGVVRYNEAKNTQDGGAPGGYKEPNSFSRGIGVGGRNAIREDPPNTMDNRRGTIKVPPWQHQKQSVEMQDWSRGGVYPESRSDLREPQHDVRSGRVQQQSNLQNNGGPGDRAGFGERTAGGSVGLGGNTDFNLRGSGDLSGSSGRGGHSFGDIGPNIGRGNGGLHGLEGYNMRDGHGAGSVGRGRGGFIGHSGEPLGRESIGLGKRNRGDDSFGGSSSKIRRDVFERDAGLRGTESDFIRNSSQSRGGYSGPKDSHAGGVVRYNEAKNTQDGGAPGGYKEPNSFSGGGDLSRRNVIREDPPHTYDNRGENRKVPPWQQPDQSVAVQVRTRGEVYLDGRSDSRERQQEMRSGGMQQQNRAPGSGQWFGNDSRPGSGQVMPWLAERIQVPVQGSSERPDSARDREQSRLARRPADSALPDRDRSPYPPFAGVQSSTGNHRIEPFLPAPHTTPLQPPIFSNTVNTISAPWAVPEQSPLVALGALQILLSVNEMQQYGSGLPQMQPQFQPPNQLMGTQPRYSRPMNNFPNSSLNNIESKPWARPATKSALGKSQPIRNQNFSLKSDQFRKHGSELDYKYTHYASKIFKAMVDDTKVEKGDMAYYKSFTTVMTQIIENRLRDLTHNDPFNKDLISIYRKAFPLSTDKETLKSTSKQLSLPKIPIQLKDHRDALKDTMKLDAFQVNDFSDLTKYVDLNLIVDPEFKEPLEEHVKAENLRYRAAAIITIQLLKPVSKGIKKGVSPEEGLHYYLKHLIAAELEKLPREEFFSTENVDVILRLYHENTSPERNRKLIEMAIEKQNEKELVPYRGMLTIPDQVAKLMQFWPDLYLKPGETSPVSADVPKEKRKVLMDLRLNYASIVIAAQVYMQHKAKYRKCKAQLDIRDADHRVRSVIEERLKKLAPTDTSKIVSSRSLVALYRSKYPEEADLELLEEVFKQLLKEMATKGRSAKDPVKIRLGFLTANILVGQTVYGRMLAKEERQLLTQPQQKFLMELQGIILKSIKRIMAESDTLYYNCEYLCKAYRKHFPQSEDATLVRHVVNSLDMELSSPDKGAKQKKHQESKSTNSQEEVSESTLAGWREACAIKVAQEALFGRYGWKKTKLSDLQYTKFQIARKIVRQQMDKISKGKHGAVSKLSDLYQLYRKFHPPAEDAVLKERVNRESDTDENQAVSQPVDKAKPNEGSSGGPTDDINLAANTTGNVTNLTTDETDDNGQSSADIMDTNTDHIKDGLDVPVDDIDVDDDDLEDY